MITKPIDVLELFPIRKNNKQKQAFRNGVQSYAEELGYQVKIEKGSVGARNLVIGNPDTANYLVTAHYDTPAQMPIPNFITPCNFWAFLIYQLLVTVLMLILAAIPGFVAIALGMNPQNASYVWLLSLYVILGFMMFGPGNKHNANDNTSGVVTVLQTAESLPEALRSKVCFVLFDLEEAGLIGSASYAKAHKAQVKNQVVLNCDCVGDGDTLMMFPTKKAKKDAVLMDALRLICAEEGSKSLTLRERGFTYYPSDQRNFPKGVGIAAFRHHDKIGLYCDKIHTKKDKILDESNVSFLRDKLIELIGSAAE